MSRCGRTKQTLRSSQAKSEQVQILRQEYWQQVTDIDLENLVFIDTTNHSIRDLSGSH